MAAIQKLARQAWDTFRLAFRDRPTLSDNLKGLQDAMTKIRAFDLNIENEKPASSGENAASASRSTRAADADGDVAPTAPVGYMHLFEDGIMTMGVFILREGSRIPLHNHPGMHGLLKVLYGNIRIRTFNTITDDWSSISVPQFEGFLEHAPPKSHLLVPTFRGIDQEFSASSDAVLLTPRTGNYHSLECVGGEAAFLDILSPPYDPVIGRDCYYFRELQTAKPDEKKLSSPKGDSPDVQWLMQTSQPYDFWCDEVQYSGPDIDLN